MNVYSDSMLVVWHIWGGFQERGPRTDLSMRYAQEWIGKLREIKLEQIPRAENVDTDALTKVGSQKDAHMLGVIPPEIQYQPSIPKGVVLDAEVDKADLWRTAIQEYIANGILRRNKDEARKLRYKVSQ